MWLLAGALWAGFKVIAWLQAGGWTALGWRTIYFAGWVGMDARAFAEPGERRAVPLGGAIVAVFVGVAILWAAVPVVDHPVARGWLGMATVLLVFHFGLFQAIAALWNRLGFHVRPIMGAPWRARTLAEFWGERWNRAFSGVARGAVFRPMVRRLGTPAGTVAGFAFSGLAHELVISVPAGAGFGLPTAYFLLQGAGVIAGRKLRLRGRPAGRALLALVVLAPAFWLFHPAFMTVVIGPFLDALTRPYN